MSILKAGILGTGFMAQTHAKSLNEIDGVEVVSVCSRNKSKAEDFIANYAKDATAYDNFSQMLEEESLSLLYVCIPPYAHSGEVEQAAKKGIHLFLEKPIAINLERARAMKKACMEASVITQIGYHFRHGGAVKKLKSLIESGEAGIPTLFQGRFFCNSLHSEWWRDINKSGGQIFEQLIHIYDMSLHMLGNPTRVSAFKANLCHKDVDDYTVEDTSSAAILFESGASACISGSNCAVPMEWSPSFTVVCKNITAHFSSPNDAIFVYTNLEEPKTENINTNDNYYLEESKDFIKSVLNKTQANAPIADGFMGLSLVSSAVDSANKAGEVKPVEKE